MSENDLRVTFYFIKCTALDSTCVLRSKRKRGYPVDHAEIRVDSVWTGASPVRINRSVRNNKQADRKQLRSTVEIPSQRNTSNLNEPYRCVFPVVNFNEYTNFLAKRSMTNTASDFIT